ncbi:LmbE family N-acetylglucosaminyl deacetylase [Gillisia mitskevichiae]|uniref:LmbE family N-acetylglucosaminyl deacetylase n=1 Tax=Gillisia mitskevichiae TaxID=270921 RepID=A0A495PRV3_9FLAO|nr:PIG-L family deacetylase [Gillisia mitskevichiae]RKS52937.1 LmbE family N-acetylglucosaminyl deacetylase [Gillisia mitskevichiae]
MRKILPFLLVLFFITAQAQAPKKLNSAEIDQALKKLNFLGSVLYLAAHPDDENTRLISYLANEVNARTGYLSITRGDGGQNLIGPELKELLGVIRTQELLAARRIDGGEQRFTRAIDFGYTKTPEESMEIWNKEEVLGDVVWAIRTFKPDVIINRFNHRTSGETHGQHTASALLSVEAFKLAENKNSYPEQLEFTEVFSPTRLYFNTSPWFYGSQDEFDNADKSNFIQFDTGVYFPWNGLSNPEIAALSRSQHKSQGFGSSGSRGSQIEYVELIDGEIPATKGDLFAGIDTSWNRLKGGAAIGKILIEVEKNYNFRDPSESLPKLVEAYKLIDNLEDSYWKNIKTAEIKDIILACSGLYIEALSNMPYSTPNQYIEVNFEAINRSDVPVEISSITVLPGSPSAEPNKVLSNNEDWKEKLIYSIPKDAKYTSPYWLNESPNLGTYMVDDKKLVGLPETPRVTKAIFNLKFYDEIITFEKELVYKSTDPVKGEVYQPFEIVPPVAASFNDKVLIYTNGEAKKIHLTITANQDNAKGKANLKASDSWKIEPKEAIFDIKNNGGTATLSFTVTPPVEQSEADLIPEITIEGKVYSDEIIKLDYEHIPLQTLVLPATTKLVKLDIKKKGDLVGYIEGAGDVIPESLEQIGYKVVRIDPNEISAASLAKFDAIVLGIRAYNMVDILKFKQAELIKYVENGGTLISQYNTNRGLVLDNLAPFKLELSRDRVTEEDAKVEFLNPLHPVLNTPNKITPKDFENWVQERGLYFSDSWAPEFTPIFSMHDTNEASSKGSLLIAKYGKGHYIYTGLSFFRQFPDAVPGAFRLFANLISIGK